MYIRIYIFNFIKNKQTNKENKNHKKQKKLKKKREYLRKINFLKKEICGRSGEDFSRHPHFRK